MKRKNRKTNRIKKTGPASLLPQNFVNTNILGVPLRLSPVFLLLAIVACGCSYDASALTYSNNVDLKYTFAPTLDVSFSSNSGFVIEDLTPGTAADSNVVTVTASSNSSDGFTLAATAGTSSDSYRNNNRLVHSNNTNYFESVATDADVALDSLGTNKWGYAIYNSGTSTWSNYNGLPAVGNAGTQLAETNSAGSASVDMKIGASSTNTQVSGTFTNDINFTITAKVVTYDYAIIYNGNGGGDTVSNVPTNTSASLQTGQTLLASSQTPTRTNYEFLGWCDGTSSNAGCDGKVYQPEDYLKISNPQNHNSGNTNNITLSAIWGAKYMQDITLAECQNRATDKPLLLYDKRDNNYYAIKKLKDNNCWMLDNLALDITEVGLDTLKGNTNADDTSLTYLKNGGGSGNYATSGMSKVWTNYYDKPLIAVGSTTSGPCNNEYCVNSDKSWSSTSVTSATINGVTSVAQGKIGVYYNYCAASAGYYCYASGAGVDDPDGTTTLQDSKYDICPKGWRLPTGSSSGEFQTLYTAYNGNYTNFQTALSTPLSGYFHSGKAYNQGDYGYFWSSTWFNVYGMYYLYVGSSIVTTSLVLNRAHGLSVRCILAE